MFLTESFPRLNLLNKTMNNLSKKWFEFSRNDLRNAEILFKNRAYEGAIWHCHQSVEKYIKGALSSIGKAVRKTHDLPALLSDSAFRFPKEILDFVQELNAYYQPSRYPDTALINPLSYDRKTVSRLLKLTKSMIQWLQHQLNRNK